MKDLILTATMYSLSLTSVILSKENASKILYKTALTVMIIVGILLFIGHLDVLMPL